MMDRTARLMLVGMIAFGGAAGAGTLRAEPELRPGTGVATEQVNRAAAELEVDLSERRLTVVRDGETIGTYSVAIGKSGHETPTGTYRISRIIWNPSWNPPNVEWAEGKKPTPPGDPNNPMGRVKIFFAEPDYYIHGTNDEASIGRAASHGCVRMTNADVVELARIVMEHGGERRDPSWFRRIVNRITDTEEVRLSNPVTVRIRA